MDQSTMPKHYRITNFCDENGVSLHLEEWTPISETPEGYWVGNDGYKSMREWKSLKDLKRMKCVRWVSKTALRRYCHPSINEAMRSFIARKKHQLAHAKLQFEMVQLCLENEAKLKTLNLDDFKQGRWGGPSTYCIGEVPAMENFNWDC